MVNRLLSATEARAPAFGRIRPTRALAGSESRVERRKAALEIGFEIVDILKPDMEPQGRTTGRPFGRGAIAVAVERNDEAFKAAPRKPHAEQLDRVEQGIDSLLRRRLQHNAEQAGRAGKIPFPDRVAGIALQCRVQAP